MKTQLISTDEVGFQPLGLATVIPFFKEHSDLDVIDYWYSQTAPNPMSDFIAFSVPTFGAIETSVKLSKSLRKQGYSNPIVFYNQYATVQPDSFLLDEKCYIVNGEFETVLEEMFNTYKKGEKLDDLEFVYSLTNRNPSKNLKRKKFNIPDRSMLPALSNYAYKDGKLVGNIETMRGCAHGCTYCSVFAAYEKRVIKIPEDIVLGDIDQVVNMGATHITFIDADFFSTGKRGVRIIEQMHAKHPHLTFDITLRLDDVVRYREFFPELKSYGCTEVTSAFEFPSDHVLKEFDKRITIKDMNEGLRLLRNTGLKIVPTFISYNPWSNTEDMINFGNYLEENNLMEDIDDMQLKTRLLLYKGSPLLQNETIKKLKLVDKGYYFDWEHPDSVVDEMHKNTVGGTEIGMRCCIKG